MNVNFPIMITVFGIKNCDTVKKSLKWLEANNISYEFYDYKKLSPKREWLIEQIAQHGLDTIVNKRGTTYRKLDDSLKASLDVDTAPNLLVENPSMIKRPILCYQNNPKSKSLVGFKSEQYEQFFNE